MSIAIEIFTTGQDRIKDFTSNCICKYINGEQMKIIIGSKRFAVYFSRKAI